MGTEAVRHHAQSITGPDLDGVTKEGMIAAMNDASILVASWPQWKREVLRYPEPKDTMKESLARVDARAEKIVADIPLSQRAIVGVNELLKGERSTIDRLGEVQYLTVTSGMYGPDGPPPWASLKEHQKWLYCNAAQAVRLAVLAEPWADEDVEAGYKVSPIGRFIIERILSAASTSRLDMARKEKYESP